MLAVLRKTEPLVAIAAAAILTGCTIEPAPYAGEVYYSGPPAVVVAPYHYGYYHYGPYGRFYGPGPRWYGRG